MGGTQKKAILRMQDGSWLAGYLPAGDFVRAGAVELLDLSARRQTIVLQSLRWICFVRDFNSGEPANPERLLRTTFASRPRLAGLWLRLTLTDNSELEGVAANDATLLDPNGLLLTPPDTRSNTQRLFIPRSSVREFTVIAVVGTATAQRKPPAVAPDRRAGQGDLFSAANPKAV